MCARAQAPRVRVGSRRVRLWRAFFSCSPRTPPFLSRTRAGPPRWRPTPPHMELLAYSPLHPGRGRGGWRAGPGRAGLLKRAVRARACASSQRGFRKQGAPTAFFSPRTPHLFGRASPPPPRPLTLSPTLSALQTMTSRLLNVVLAMACIRRPDTMPSTSAKKEEAALVRSSKPAFFSAQGAVRFIRALPASKTAAKKLAAEVKAKEQAGLDHKKLTAVITTATFATSRRPATAGAAGDVRTARRVRFTLPSDAEKVMEAAEVGVVTAPTTPSTAGTCLPSWEQAAAAAASREAAAVELFITEFLMDALQCGAPTLRPCYMIQGLIVHRHDIVRAFRKMKREAAAAGFGPDAVALATLFAAGVEAAPAPVKVGRAQRFAPYFNMLDLILHENVHEQRASARAAVAAAAGPDAKAMACLFSIAGPSPARLLAFEAVARAFAHPTTIGEAGLASVGAAALMKELDRAADGWAAVEVEEEAEAEVVALVAPSTTTATPAPPAFPARTWAQVVSGESGEKPASNAEMATLPVPDSEEAEEKEATPEAVIEVEEEVEAEAEVVALVAPSTTTANLAPPTVPTARTWDQVVCKDVPSAADNESAWARLRAHESLRAWARMQ